MGSVAKGISARDGEKAGKGNPSCREDRPTRFACYLQPRWERLDIFDGALRIEAIVAIDALENRIDPGRALINVLVDRARVAVRTLYICEKQASLEGKADVLAGHCQHPMIHQRNEPSTH